MRRIYRRAAGKTVKALPVKKYDGGSSDHGEGYITQAVLSMDSIPETVREGKGYMHGSSLIGICPRKVVLANIDPSTNVQKAMSGMRIMWALGRAAEHHVRTQFILAKNFKGIIGHWKCNCGESMTTGLFDSGRKCHICRSKHTHYNEMPLMDHANRVVGNPDMLYFRPDNQKVRVVEIKSIRKVGFDTLETAEPNHIMQAAIYRRLAMVNDFDVDDTVTIFYVCKDFSPKVYNEYHVKITDSITKQVDLMFADAKKVTEFLTARENGGKPELPEKLKVCSSISSTTAKNCPRCTLCFSM